MISSGKCVGFEILLGQWFICAIAKIGYMGLVIAILIGILIYNSLNLDLLKTSKNPYNLVDDQPQVTSETTGILQARHIWNSVSG